jgi:hypothetical protein
VVNRRKFLAGLGASLLAAPYCRLLSGEALAQTAGAQRMLIFFSPNGTVHQHWRPQGSEESYSFAPGSILEPLSHLREQLLVIDGLDFHNGNNHEGGMAAMLTNGGGQSTQTQGKSIDQFVAAQIGGDTRFSSLEFGVQTSAWGGSGQTRMSYAGPSTYVTPDDNPLNVYGRMFEGMIGDAGQAQLLRERRLSVLDIAQDELIDLHSRVGVAERIKLEAHMESLYSVEQSLAEVGGCEPGVSPGALAVYDNDNFPAIGRAQMDLAVSALACGMTRVASIQFSHTVGPPVFTWCGVTDGHHSLSHAADSNTGAVADFVATERWYAEQFAYLVEQLMATPDPETGGNLLDSTVVLWAKELGDGRLHTCEDVPFIIAGDGGGAFRTGRYVQCGGQYHSKLLVSLCSAMGLSNETFGDPGAGTGGLSELT